MRIKILAAYVRISLDLRNLHPWFGLQLGTGMSTFVIYVVQTTIRQTVLQTKKNKQILILDSLQL